MARKSQRVLIFAPTHNAEGKKDVTGAFLPEANALAKMRPGSRVVQFDNSKPFARRKAEVLATMAAAKGEGFTSVAFFCHGWMDGIQAGFKRKDVDVLATAIADVVTSPPNVVKDDVVVPLFCCSTGKDPQDDPLTAAGTGDDSFADKLRDALCKVGQVNCRVVGHTTVAHTTKNPMVLFMDGMGVETGGVGGYPPVSPKSQPWRAWKAALRGSDLRLRMPYMMPAEIHDELTGGGAVA